ncbi:uncharacterized protein LAESUDRAFT_812603 [Laetiporus sulphureus 93-53]|uniref:C2H2-type domain-containing protein n=1 Tax=Laetiporus sulphureus 93-53 TaxID=1314785 RepID=A0A165EAW8_9APHY|nr:uncharacterized protein LAESUDRAFT_812603 [Laetiporus sulphureus 93-53]KZT06622.1 hypothetical protein LAESUDRAFT_812603 [Laetiporus sulphureus 93-53]
MDAGSSFNVNDFISYPDWVREDAELGVRKSETSAAVYQSIPDYPNITAWERRFDQPGPSNCPGIGGEDISGSGLGIGSSVPGPSSFFLGSNGRTFHHPSYNMGADMFMAQAQRYGNGQIAQAPVAPAYMRTPQPAYPPGFHTTPFRAAPVAGGADDSFPAATWRLARHEIELYMPNGATDEAVGRPSKRSRHNATEPGPPLTVYAPGASPLLGLEHHLSIPANDFDISKIDPILLAESPLGTNGGSTSSRAHDSIASSSSQQVHAFVAPPSVPVAGPSRSYDTWSYSLFENMPAASQSPAPAVSPPVASSFSAGPYTAALACPSHPLHTLSDLEISPHGGYPHSGSVPPPQQSHVFSLGMTLTATNSNQQASPPHGNDEHTGDAGETGEYLCKWWLIEENKICGHISKSWEDLHEHCKSLHFDHNAGYVSCCWQDCKKKNRMKIEGLYKHLKIHYQPPVQCGWCKHYFSRTDSLRRHGKICGSRPTSAVPSELMQEGTLQDLQDATGPSESQTLAGLLGLEREDASELASEARAFTGPPESEVSEGLDGPSQSRTTSEDRSTARETHEVPRSTERMMTRQRLRSKTQVPTSKKVRPTQRRKTAHRVPREERRIESQRGAETMHLQNGMTLRPRPAAPAPISGRAEESSKSNRVSATDEPAQDSGSREGTHRPLNDQGDQSLKRKRH